MNHWVEAVEWNPLQERLLFFGGVCLHDSADTRLEAANEGRDEGSERKRLDWKVQSESGSTERRGGIVFHGAR